MLKAILRGPCEEAHAAEHQEMDALEREVQELERAARLRRAEQAMRWDGEERRRAAR